MVPEHRTVFRGEDSVRGGEPLGVGGVAVAVSLVVLQDETADVQQPARGQGAAQFGDDRLLRFVVGDARQDREQQDGIEGR